MGDKYMYVLCPRCGKEEEVHTTVAPHYCYCDVCGTWFVPRSYGIRTKVSDCWLGAPWTDTEIEETIERGKKMKATVNNDKVNHPSHYTFGKVEVIDYIKDKLPPEGFQGYCEGNVLKYVSRWQHKDGLQDLKKAQVYLGWLIESVEAAQVAAASQEEGNG